MNDNVLSDFLEEEIIQAIVLIDSSSYSDSEIVESRKRLMMELMSRDKKIYIEMLISIYKKDD